MRLTAAIATAIALVVTVPGLAEAANSTGSTSVGAPSPLPPSSAAAASEAATPEGPDSPTATGGAAAGAVAPAPSPTAPTTGPTVPGTVAKIHNGLAYAPTLAPLAVQRAIWAANEIVGKPYIYGGGHAAFIARGYDCSGSVSFALHGGSLLGTPMDSSEFMSFGVSGRGEWVTIYSNPGHMYAVIAGIRLDTSSAGDPSHLPGPRWRPVIRSHRGFLVRHPLGL